MEIQTKYTGVDCDVCQRYEAIARNGKVMDEEQLTLWLLHLATHIGQMTGLFMQLMKALGDE